MTICYNAIMAQTLFFEGPVRSGKSTALRTALLPYLPQLGGFVVQRLLDSSGQPSAYRLIGLNNLIESLGYSEAASQFLAVDAVDTDMESDVFLRVAPTREIYWNVLETTGVSILQGSMSKRIILLDEIGGVDLRSDQFCNQLCHLLQSKTPCIGIFKESGKAREALFLQQSFRRFISIHSVQQDSLDEIAPLVEAFLQNQGIFL